MEKQSYKTLIYHFEPNEGFPSPRFIDSNGVPLIEPCYQIELNHLESIELSSLAGKFPKDLSFGWMCSPIFRDVTVWQNSLGQRTRIFELCFTCDQYELSDGSGILIVEDVKKNDFIEPIKSLKALFKKFDIQNNIHRNLGISISESPEGT